MCSNSDGMGTSTAGSKLAAARSCCIWCRRGIRRTACSWCGNNRARTTGRNAERKVVEGARMVAIACSMMLLLAVDCCSVMLPLSLSLSSMLIPAVVRACRLEIAALPLTRDWPLPQRRAAPPVIRTPLSLYAAGTRRAGTFSKFPNHLIIPGAVATHHPRSPLVILLSLAALHHHHHHHLSHRHHLLLR